MQWKTGLGVVKRGVPGGSADSSAAAGMLQRRE